MSTPEQSDLSNDGSTTDRVTAGLVLIRALLAGEVPPEVAWPTIAHFHATVVRPVLHDSASPGRAMVDPSAWRRVGVSANDLLEAACSATPDVDPVSEDVLSGLMELAERMDEDVVPPAMPSSAVPSSAVPSSGDGPDILVEQADGWCQVLTARPAAADAGDWQQRVDAAGLDAETALRDTLAQFPTLQRTARPPRTDRPLAVWWPPEVSFAAPAAALPIALWHLGRITGFGPPSPLSAGDLVNGLCAPLEGHALTTRTTAAAAAGRDLLAPTRTGWCRFQSDGERTEMGGLLTLDGAATVLWGDMWSRWKRDRHADELRALGWRVIDWRRTPEHQPIADLDTSQSRRLTRHFQDSKGASVAVLGGTPRSGKSATVRRLAVALSSRKRNPWQVQVIAGPNRELPDRHGATTAARHAFALLEHQDERTLLVFEDLHPITDNRADEVLMHVSEQLRTPVLGVLQYSEDSPVEWSTEGVFVVTAVVGTQARRQFVADLAAADPSLDAEAGFAELADDQGQDLRRITQVMAGGQNPDARLAARFAELANSERAPLVLAAAVSLIGGEVDASTFEQLDEEDRDLFGVTGSTPSSVRLMGMDDCLKVIDLHRESRPQNPAPSSTHRVQVRNDVIVELIEPDFVEALNDRSGRVADLLIGARLFHRAVCEKMIERAEDEGLLPAWASAAPVMSVVRVLGLTELLPETLTRAMVARLLTKLPSRSESWHPAQVCALVHTLQDIEFVLSADEQDEFTRWLVGAVDRIITDRVGHPEERFALLVALERLDSDAAKALVAERTLDVLDGLRVDDVTSYRLVRQVEEMQRRLERRSPEDVTTFPVDQERPVQALLTHEPEENDGVGVLIESMGLRQQFEKLTWEVRFEPYEVPLTAAMRFATAAGMASALNSLRSSKPAFCTWLLSNWTDFSTRARDMLRRSDPTEAATLLKTIARSNASTASGLLYTSHEVVDYQLVKSFAQRIRGLSDATGAGLLLSATHSIGDLFYSGSNTFATELAEEIGEQKLTEMIRNDPRISTRYHLIKGVWDVEASYREQLLDLVLDLVAQSVRRGRKHWGAEIALRVGADAELGELALDRLQELIPADVLVRNMFHGSTAHARVMFHRLGRVLHPEVAARYRDRWDLHAFIEGLSTSSPGAALAVCAEVATTLRDADVPHAGSMIFTASGGADHWARRLAFGRKAESFAQAITNLSALDRTGAGEVLGMLRARESRVRIGSRNVDSLVAWLRRAMLHDALTASSLIGAVHKVKPEIAAELLDEVREDRHAIYVFRGDIQQIQDPVALSTAARNFARAGMTRGAVNAGWIDSVYTVRVQNLDWYGNPRAVTALLRMISTWDSHWGAAAAGQIGLPRIGRRMRRGRVEDLPAAVALVRTLCALDHKAAAQRLVEDLLTNDLGALAARAPLTTLYELAEVLGELEPSVVPRTLRILHSAVDTLVRRSVVLDERTHWQQMGRALWTIRHLEGRVSGPISEPGIRPNSAHAPVVAWMAAELDMPGWGDDALGRMRAKLRHWRFSGSGDDQAYVLLATARGWAPELRTASSGWELASTPLWLIRLLYQEVRDDPRLSPILAAAEPVVRDRVSRATARSDWDAHWLRLVLGTPVTTGRSSPMHVVRGRHPEAPYGAGGTPLGESGSA